MSFWTLSDGSSAVTNEKEFDAGGGDFETLPKGTKILVLIEEASWKKGYEISEEFVNLKARVLKPECYANRVLPFKLWVDELDPGAKDEAAAKKKRDKHRLMLMAIDANAKGKLAKLTSRPTDADLAFALSNAQFVATLGVWENEINGKASSGNWLMAASPKTAEVSAAVEKKTPVNPANKSGGFFGEGEDDVPF